VSELADVVATAQGYMADASAIVLDGFRLRSDAKIIRYPDRYADPRGEAMWKTVWDVLQHRSEPGEAATDEGQAGRCAA
jgi:hypothetical protein